MLIALKMLVTEVCNRQSLNRGDDVVVTLTCAKPECQTQITGRHGIDMDAFELGREYVVQVQANEAEFTPVPAATADPLAYSVTTRRKDDPK